MKLSFQYVSVYTIVQHTLKICIILIYICYFFHSLRSFIINVFFFVFKCVSILYFYEYLKKKITSIWIGATRHGLTATTFSTSHQTPLKYTNIQYDIMCVKIPGTDH